MGIPCLTTKSTLQITGEADMLGAKPGIVYTQRHGIPCVLFLIDLCVVAKSPLARKPNVIHVLIAAVLKVPEVLNIPQ